MKSPVKTELSGADMDDSDASRIEAIHPHWHGFLRLSAGDMSVLHEGNANRGKYDLRDGRLTVYWEQYAPDVFVNCLGKYVHEKVLAAVPATEGLFAVTVNKQLFSAKAITLSVPNSDYEVALRLNSSDLPTFYQVFGICEYDSPSLPQSAGSILDLGANVGLATVFFGLKYPGAEILAVEPETSNYSLMASNTAALGPRIRREHAAVWVHDGHINLQTDAEDGSSLGAWGVRTSDRIDNASAVTNCFKLDTLLDRAGFSTVDILKVDIEGAELQVFSEGAEKWLPRVGMIIIETHDRFQPGSEAAVRQAIAPLFEELPSIGENLFFRRIGSVNSGKS
jgi:FkbM family methyltransferase